MTDIEKIVDLLDEAGLNGHTYPQSYLFQDWDKYRRKIASGLIKYIGNLSFNGEQIEELKAELATSDKLLKEQYRVMDEIPECPVHGNRCISHAVEWVLRVKTLGRIIAQEKNNLES